VQAIYGDGTYIYLGTQASNGELRAFGWNAGALEEITGASLNLGSIGVYTIYCDTQGYIYIGTTDGYVYAYSFNGSSFTLRGSVDTTASGAFKITGDGTYLFVSTNATTARIRAYSFDGTTFTARGSLNPGHGGIPYGLVCIGNGQLVAAYWSGQIDEVSHNGSSLTLVSSTAISVGSDYFHGLDTDGQYYHIPRENYAVDIYEITGGVASLVGRYLDSGVPNGYYHSLRCGNSYTFYVSGNYIKAVRLDLTAAFTVDKTRAAIGESIQFTLT
jgi:hypothetical protein